MALARVVTFDGVSRERMTELEREIRDGDRPEGMPATEIAVLHDPEGERSLVILYFDSDEDYRQADAILNAMPADETPGRRASVARYDVAFRMTV